MAQQVNWAVVDAAKKKKERIASKQSGITEDMEPDEVRKVREMSASQKKKDKELDVFDSMMRSTPPPMPPNHKGYTITKEDMERLEEWRKHKKIIEEHDDMQEAMHDGLDLVVKNVRIGITVDDALNRYNFQADDYVKEYLERERRVALVQALYSEKISVAAYNALVGKDNSKAEDTKNDIFAAFKQ